MRIVIQWDFIVMIENLGLNLSSQKKKKIIILNSFNFSRFCDLLKIE